MSDGNRSDRAATGVILGTTEANGNRRWTSIRDVETGGKGFVDTDFADPVRDDPHYSTVAIAVGEAIRHIEQNTAGLIHRLDDLTDEELFGVLRHIHKILAERVECHR